jgi:hypothetical protein
LLLTMIEEAADGHKQNVPGHGAGRT